MSVLTPGRAGRRTALALAALLCPTTLAACGGSSNRDDQAATAQPNGRLNTARVALAIQQSILSQRHIHATVTCPPRVLQKKGRTFTCVATTYTKVGHHPVHTTFTVFQKDSNGNVFYQS